MFKKIIFPLIIGMCLTTSLLMPNKIIKGTNAMEDKTYYVDFFSNYLREEFTLSTDFKGKGNNLLYQTISVKENSLIEKPSDPIRKNYEFNGWFNEEECITEWDFINDKVTKNMRLYAKWNYASKKDDGEPIYNPPSTVLPSGASSSYEIESIMNFEIEDNLIKLPKAALAKLEANKDNILPLMEYRVKEDKTITATYENNKIKIECGDEIEIIVVKDNSNNLKLSNSSYETKASKYEQNALEEDNYHVMLAGSSSIEFWTTSREDLDPIISFNHGIGGTTIEEWDEKLNARLVYPYKPKMVVYYVGINNVINSKQDVKTIWNNLENFFNHTHEALPNTKIQYIMMNLIPGYTNYFETINAINTKVIEYQQNNDWLTLINPGTALLKENGEPNAAYFRTDGLHLSLYGYVIWGAKIKESIINGLNKD